MNNTASIVSSAASARDGEDNTPPPRSNRFLSADKYWFYRTREGHEIGPYTSRSSAEKAAEAFATFTSRVNSSNLEDLVHIHIDRICKKAHEKSQVPLRDGERAIPRSRHPRIIHRGRHWFFITREGPVVGPYEAPGDAKESAQVFTSFAKTISRACVEGLIDTMNKDLRHA